MKDNATEAQMRREDARRAVRGYLAERPTIAAHALQIRRGVKRELDLTLEEVSDALTFLIGKAWAKDVPDEMGSTPYFQITSEGILAHERDPLA